MQILIPYYVCQLESSLCLIHLQKIHPQLNIPTIVRFVVTKLTILI